MPRQEIEENSFRKIKEKCKENNVKVNTEVISNAKSIVAQVADYAQSNNVGGLNWIILNNMPIDKPLDYEQAIKIATSEKGEKVIL